MNRRDYTLVTAAYWAFTITDGALRMLVLLHFHDLGYSPVSIAFLFILYEAFGVVTNLLGGWAGARSGLNRTLTAGLLLQVIALVTLSFQDPGWVEWISVIYVMGAQALSGVAKDLTKMSSKSAVKFVAGDSTLFQWVAVLTGSKNALKGVGFFVGSALLAWVGFESSLRAMAAVLGVVLVGVVALLRETTGRASAKPAVRSIWSKSPAINRLSTARFFLFGSRDIWFVVALPVFLAEELDWSFQAIGGFLAAWVIGYGIVQSVAPQIVGSADAAVAGSWVLGLAGLTSLLVAAAAFDASVAILVGLVAFGVVFAVNSSVHSYLVLAYSRTDDEVAMDVGFYYAANAAGRLVGTLLSGLLYLIGGLVTSLAGAVVFLVASWFSTRSIEAPTAVASVKPLR